MIPAELVPGERMPPVPDGFLTPDQGPAFKRWLLELGVPGHLAGVWLRRWSTFVGVQLTARDYADVGAPPLRGARR